MLPDDGHARLCVCGHPYSAHQHYRRGTECSVCPDCRRWRRGLGQVMRDVKGLIGRRAASEAERVQRGRPLEFVLGLGGAGCAPAQFGR